MEYELFRGTVGDGAAAEFMGFFRVWRELPSVEDILANPADALVPDDPAALYAVCEAPLEKAADGNGQRPCEPMPDAYHPNLVSCSCVTQYAATSALSAHPLSPTGLKPTPMY